MKQFTQQYLNECLSYDEQSGILTWKKRPLEHFRSIGWMNKWNRNKSGTTVKARESVGYVVLPLDGKILKAHRVAFMIMTGEFPVEVDHKDGVRDNNVWSNLRSVTRLENAKNRKRRVDNKSGFNGVSQRKDSGKWRVKIGKKIIAQCDTKEEAIKVRAQADKDLGYHPNHGRLT